MVLVEVYGSLHGNDKKKDLIKKQFENEDRTCSERITVERKIKLERDPEYRTVVVATMEKVTLLTSLGD